jgi:hypothetical protein
MTAEVSQLAIEAGVPEAMPFTSTADATPNAVYQRIGYRPVLIFTSPSESHPPRIPT